MTFAYVIIFIISLVGNALMIYVIHKTPRLRTTTNLLVANMAVADVIITFFAVPSTVMYLYLQHIWLSGVIGDITCKVVQYGLTLSIAASVLTHILIAIDRFICVVFPFKRVTFFKKVRPSYVLTWCASLLLMSPHLVVYDSAKLPNGKSYCRVSRLEYLHFLEIYYVLVFVTLYLIPLLFIATLYAFICRKLWRHKVPGVRSPDLILKRDFQNKNTIKMLIILVIAFTLCWLPVHVVHLLEYFRPELHLPHVALLLSFWACHSHSAINPLLVVFLNGLYRKECQEKINKKLASLSIKRSTGTNIVLAPQMRTAISRAPSPQALG